MNGYLRQSSAAQVRTIGAFLDDGDFKTLENGLTIANTDIVISKNGAADTTKNSGGATAHGAGGIYTLTWDATDTDTVGELFYSVKVAGALVVFGSYVVLEEAAYDAMFAASADPKADINVATIDANAITATAIAADAITAAKIADGAIDANTFAAGAITAAAIATGAIDADALAADAVAEIADGVWDEDATGHQTQGTFGQAIGDPVADTNTIFKAVVTDAAGATVGVDVVAVKAETASIQADTDDLQTKIGTPSNLGGGATVAANLSDIEAQTDDIGVAGAGLTAVPWNAAWDAEVQSEVDDALVAQNLDHLVKSAVDTDFATTVHLNSVVGHLADAGGTATFDRTTDALEVLGAATAPSAASIADAVWEEAIADHSGTVGSTAEQLAAAGAAGDPWATALPGAYGAGTAGKIIGDNVNATISSRLAPTTAGRTLDVTATGEAGIDWGNIGSPTTVVNLSGTTVKTATDVEADTQDIQGRLPAALVGGRIDADVGAISTDATAADNLETMLDGTGGQTLSLRQLNIVNDNGTALVAHSTGNDGHGISASGHVSGMGIRAAAGTNGIGLDIVGGSVVGAGMRVTAPGNGEGATFVAAGANAGLAAYGSAGAGIHAEGDGAGAGIAAVAGATGHGIEAAGGNTSGDGMHLSATDGDGIEAIGAGGGNADIKADITGSVTGNLSGSVGSVTGLTAATVHADLDDIQASVGALPTATQNADALLDRSNGIESSYTLRQALRLMLASLAGKLSGAATATVTIRDVNDAKDRITATVDADGNRTAVTTDVS